MVSLKTPEVPKPMSRADFVSVEAYVKYLEQQIEFTKMKEEMQKLKRNMEKGPVTEEAADEVPLEDLGPDEEADVESGGREESEEEEMEGQEEGVEKTRFIKGHSKAKNPGKLVVDEKQRFIFNSARSFEGGIKNYYICAQKQERKGKDKCKVSAVIETDKDGENPIMTKAPILSEHNHRIEKSLVIKWDIMADMETMMVGDVSLLPNVVMKRVILKYQQKYRNNPDLWMEVQSSLPTDESMTKRLRNIRMKSFGRLPQSRDELDLKSLLEKLKEWGGENVLILDSDKMWEDEKFRAEFSGDELFADGETPQRALLFITPILLQQLAGATKWSQVLLHFE